MSHTQTKLRVGDKYKTDIFADRAGHAIARTVNPQATGEDEENARRIVACWNACDGVSISFLELLANLPFNQVMAYENLEAQRNELLEALREMLESIEDHPCHTTDEDYAESEGGDVAFVSHLGRIARAAIEKVEA